MLVVLVLAVACGSDATPEPVIQEKVVTVEVVKEVQVTVEVPGEVMEKEVQVTVEVPVEVTREVEVPGEIVEVTKEVIKEVEVTKEVIKEVQVTPTPTALPAPIAPPDVAIIAGAKSGGSFRFVWVFRPGHYDWLQATSIANLGSSSANFNGLIRRNYADGGRTWAPDLATSWRIAGDGLSYTFFLRDGVEFSDGATMTSEDVIASWNRILDPPAGILSLRKAAFNAVTGIEALDAKTVRFSLEEPAVVTLDAIGMEWNRILQKKTLEDNNFDLKTVQDPPGTGPYVFDDHIFGEKWVHKKNPNYFRDGLPYLDEIVLLHAGGANRGPMVLADRADAGSSDPASLRIAQERGWNWEVYTTFLPWGLQFNVNRAPFNDVRVRKAIDLVLPRQVMQKSIQDASMTFLGRWIHPASAFSPSEEELFQMQPMKEDKTLAILQAKALMKEAGYEDGFSGVDYKVRRISYFVTHSEIVQAVLKRDLNIEVNLNNIENRLWLNDSILGDFDISHGAVNTTLNDPSDGLNNFYTCGGASNLARYCSKEFDSLLRKVDREFDPVKRKELVFQAYDILERDMPVAVFAYSGLIWIAQDFVKNMPNRVFVGPYDFNKWDNVWLDK
jgi:peptide/nickel transport system substrate-binding protein